MAVAEALLFAERLHMLSQGACAADAPALARSLSALCGSSARGGEAMSALAGACRSTADTLASLEFELKRLRWREPVRGTAGNAEGNAGDDGGGPKNPALSTAPANRDKSEALVAALVATAESRAQVDSSSGATVDTASSAAQVARDAAAEELWVMDQLDGILKHSR